MRYRERKLFKAHLHIYKKCKITSNEVQHWDHMSCCFGGGLVFVICLCFRFSFGIMIVVYTSKSHEIYILSLSVHMG